MGRGGLWGAGGRLFEAGRLLTFSASKKGANSNKYGISNDCSGLHENPEQSGVFGTRPGRILGCDSQD